MTLPPFTELQRQGLQEFITIGVGRAAAQLGAMVQRPILLSVPHLWLVEELSQVAGINDGGVSVVEQAFSGQLEGAIALTFPVDAGHRLVSLLLGEDAAMLPEAERSSALIEVGNIVVNAVMGSLGNMTGLELDFALPLYREGDLATLLGHVSGALLAAEVTIQIDGQDISGTLLLFLRAGSLADLGMLIERMAGG